MFSVDVPVLRAVGGNPVEFTLVIVGSVAPAVGSVAVAVSREGLYGKCTTGILG